MRRSSVCSHRKVLIARHMLNKSPPSPISACIAVVTAVHILLLLYLAMVQSPNIDELAHLSSGLAFWQFGLNEPYCVNPPFVKCLCSLPMLAMQYEHLWADFGSLPHPRPEFVLAEHFVESHADRWCVFLIAGRLILLPFSLLALLILRRWSNELYGRRASLLAHALWCFCPNVLTWFSVITTDGVATAAGLASSYAFWKWLKAPHWRHAILAGILLGFALLTKLTWIVLFIVWPILWLVYAFPLRRAGRSCVSSMCSLCCILSIGWYVLNAAYSFDGTFTQLSQYAFYSRILSGKDGTIELKSPANRFSGTLLGCVPVPLPADYVRGVDLQKADFDAGRRSFLLGTWRNGGWYGYYIVGLLAKIPASTWLLAVILCSKRSTHCSLRECLCLRCNLLRWCACRQLLPVAAPLIAVICLVSSQSGFSEHFRYILPSVPFIYILLSQVASYRGTVARHVSAIVIALVVWSSVSSLSAYPHMVSYFNEAVGGPFNGHRIMLGSAFSWTQDHFFIKRWLDRHEDIGAPYLLLEHSVSPERLGIHTRGRPPTENASARMGVGESDIAPGWHIMNVKLLNDPALKYRHYLKQRPVAMIGYSTCVFYAPESVSRDHAQPRLSFIASGCGEVSAGLRQSGGGTGIKVAVFGRTSDSPGPAADVLEGIEAFEGATTRILGETAIQEGALGDFDVLIVPGGSGKSQGGALGGRGKEEIRRFVASGGGYIGICAGAFLAGTMNEWELGLVNSRATTGDRFVPGVGSVPIADRGWGTVDVQLTAEGSSVLGSSMKQLRLPYTGGPIMCPANNAELPNYIVLGTYRSEVWKYPFQKGMMISSPAIIGTCFGKGKVVLFGVHPELAQESRELLLSAIRICAKAN